jgi:hypothetical protein
MAWSYQRIFCKNWHPSWLLDQIRHLRLRCLTYLALLRLQFVLGQTQRQDQSQDTLTTSRRTPIHRQCKIIFLRPHTQLLMAISLRQLQLRHIHSQQRTKRHYTLPRSSSRHSATRSAFRYIIMTPRSRIWILMSCWARWTGPSSLGRMALSYLMFGAVTLWRARIKLWAVIRSIMRIRISIRIRNCNRSRELST